MTTKKNEAVAIEIKPIDVKTVNVRIQGTAPLIVHKWSEKAKREMLEKQMGTTKYKSKHEPKNPVADFIGSAYWLTPEPTEGTEEAFRKDPHDPMKSLTAQHNLTVQADLREHGISSDLYCQIGGHHSEASWEEQVPRFMNYLWC